MKLLPILIITSITIANPYLETENDFTQKEGYYFSYQINTKLGGSEIWLSDYYNGFIEKETWDKNDKLKICDYSDSKSNIFELVREENQFTIEKDYTERIVLDKKTKLDSLKEMCYLSKKVFKKSKRKNIVFQIIYGSFKFKKIEGNANDYENGLIENSHLRRRIGIKPKKAISFLELVDYSNIRLLSEKEVKKLKIKKKTCD